MLNTTIPQQILNNSNVVSKTELEEKTESIKTQADKAASDAASAQKEAKEKFPLTGGTLTGKLVIGDVNHEVETSQVSIVRASADITEESPSVNRNWSVEFADKNKVVVGIVGANHLVSGATQASLVAYRPNSSGDKINNNITVRVNSDGTRTTFCAAPNENSYSNEVDTLRASINRHPQIVTSDNCNIYIDSDTGSDTVDLNAGRGLSPEKPFKTLGAVFRYLMNHIVGSRLHINIFLMSDLTLASRSITRMMANNLRSVSIQSLDTARPITIRSAANYAHLYMDGGELNLNYINFENIVLTSTGYFSGSIIRIGQSVTLTGTNTLPQFFNLWNNNANVDILSPLIVNGVVDAATINVSGGYFRIGSNTISGMVTGKRYNVINGGIIIVNGRGPNAIPGTIAGTCDTISTYN